MYIPQSDHRSRTERRVSAAALEGVASQPRFPIPAIFKFSATGVGYFPLPTNTITPGFVDIEGSLDR
jgi:hypothetical protein